MASLTGIYRHYKGTLYVVTGVALHTEENKELVLYHALHDPSKVYARPRHMFVDYVPGQKRFTKLKAPDLAKLYAAPPKS